MTTLIHEFRAIYAFMERNANLVKRYLIGMANQYKQCAIYESGVLR